MLKGKKRLSSRMLAMFLAVLMILQNVPSMAYAGDLGGYQSRVSNELWLEYDGEEEAVTENLHILQGKRRGG